MKRNLEKLLYGELRAKQGLRKVIDKEKMFIKLLEERRAKMKDGDIKNLTESLITRAQDTIKVCEEYLES